MLHMDGIGTQTAPLSLTPLLAPRSIAFVGATDREGSFGKSALAQLRAGGFSGRVDLINPNRREIDGMPCVPTLADLSEPPDLAIMLVPNDRLEAQMQLAAQVGARAATIFSSCYVDDDNPISLTERIRTIALEAGMPLCGANGNGFFNVAANTHVAWYGLGRLEPGPIGLISHSGGLFLTFAGDDKRLQYNLIVSPGQELVVSLADYMHYMLDQPETRVIALFAETVRNPERFIAALERAQQQEVPVVALKVGRTAESARLAKSHSGAMTGDDDAYEAVFSRYGVARVRTPDELAVTCQLLSQPKRFHPGGLGAVLDSGGARGLLIDLAADLGIPFAQIDETTRQKLAAHLEYPLEPINPLDAWGTGAGYHEIFRDTLTAIADDPDTSVALLISNIGLDLPMNRDFYEIAKEASAASEKPIAIAMNFGRIPNPEILRSAIDAGIPVLDGIENAMLAVKHAMRHRDFIASPPDDAGGGPAPEVISAWRQRLGSKEPLSEAEGMALLAAFGIETPRTIAADTLQAAGDAADAIGYPVVLKTAMPGTFHKSDVGGVRVGLADRGSVEVAYTDLDGRLGPQVTVQAMIQAGVELSLGLVRDEQFGPLVSIGAGGIFVELLRDRKVLLPPFGPAYARSAIDALKVRPLLDGIRNVAAVDVDAVAKILSRFSILAAALGDLVAEADVNPIIATAKGCIAADALFVQAAIGDSPSPIEGH